MRETGFYIFAGFPGMSISRWRPVKQRRKRTENKVDLDRSRHGRLRGGYI